MKLVPVAIYVITDHFRDWYSFYCWLTIFYEKVHLNRAKWWWGKKDEWTKRIRMIKGMKQDKEKNGTRHKIGQWEEEASAMKMTWEKAMVAVL